MPYIADAIAAFAAQRDAPAKPSTPPANPPQASSPNPTGGKSANHKQANSKTKREGGDHPPVDHPAAPEPAEPPPPAVADAWAADEEDHERELTDREKQALAALSDPNNRGSSFAEIAKGMGMSESNFRRLRARPRFQKALAGAVTSAAKAAAPQVLQACIQSAREPGKDGFQDRKLLFQLAGVLDEKGRVSGATADALKGMTSIADRLSQALARTEEARQARPGDDAVVIDHEPDPAD